MQVKSIRQATAQYEAWLADHIRVVARDLAAKHEVMAQDPFSFLRATFYRWMQLFVELCPKLTGAPTTLAVGDLHVENYAGLPNNEIFCSRLFRNAVRAPDPFLAVHGRWVLRRLAPYCSRIELSQLALGHDEEKLLRAMGRELANVHLGTRRAGPAGRRDLRKRKPSWLRDAAETMVDATLQDWKEWRKSMR